MVRAREIEIADTTMVTAATIEDIYRASGRRWSAWPRR